MTDYCQIKEETILLAVKALPGASKTEFAGIQDGRLRIKIAAVPEDGRANAELAAFLSGALGCPKRNVAILKGKKSRLKTVALPLACKIPLEKVLEKEKS